MIQFTWVVKLKSKDKEKQKNMTNNESMKSYKKYWIMLLITAIIVCLIMFGIVQYFRCLAMKVANTPLAKPVIYLYPEEATSVVVKLGNEQLLTCSYPMYNGGWEVIAYPDGTLIDINTQRELYSLYWEGKRGPSTDMKEGFVVRGKDVATFFEEKLDILGLTNKEAQEFIIYWLPKLQNNEYNYIRFATMEEINKHMPLEISKSPDSIIRILMQYKPLKSKIDVLEQKLETPKREGFVVVEWGGTEIK